MILGINAINIRGGGGTTHLVELLRMADPRAHGFSKVVVWSGRKTLNLLPDYPWLEKHYNESLDKDLVRRSFWQFSRFDKLIREVGCDVLFVPGGSYIGKFRPVVSMSQNMLPFLWRELLRYGCSWPCLKYAILRLVQGSTFRRADGVIFLTRFAQKTVMRVIHSTRGRMAIIPHGINERFFCSPREQQPLSHYSYEQPFRILYVSLVDVYKHQWNAADAVFRLRKKGLPVELDLVGPACRPALKRLRKTLMRIDPEEKFIRYHGLIAYHKLPRQYRDVHLCLFASSCENLPNILLENMASGLPVVCSKCGPMPEILKDAGRYVDPEDPEDMARVLEEVILSPDLRSSMASASYREAQNYSWHRCACETFTFLSEIVSRARQ